MICHVCQLPASLQCPMCNRGACSAHTKPDPGGYRMELDGRRWQTTTMLLCSPCADGWAADTDAIRKAHQCDICSKVTIEHIDGRMPSCAVCDKQFCNKHGQIISYERGNKIDCWIRCQKHAKTAVRGLDGVGWFKRRSLGAPDFANISESEYRLRVYGIS